LDAQAVGVLGDVGDRVGGLGCEEKGGEGALTAAASPAVMMTPAGSPSPVDASISRQQRVAYDLPQPLEELLFGVSGELDVDQRGAKYQVSVAYR
jgi:hypothetical protein